MARHRPREAEALEGSEFEGFDCMCCALMCCSLL